MNYRQYLAQGQIARRLLIVILTMAVVLALAGSLALAQGEGPRRINIGDTVTGTLNAQNFAQVYMFQGEPATPVAVVALSQSQGLALALLVTAADGQTIAQAVNLEGPQVALPSVSIPAAGTYYITVLRATGAQGDSAGEFILALNRAGSAASTPAPQPTSTSASPQTANLPEGLGIELSWSGADDLNLEVRDPVGGSVFFNSTRVPSGGTYAGDVNGGCTNTVTNATERVQWPRGPVPLGSYEIIVYYVQACSQPATPRDFSVVVTANGRRQNPISATLNQGEQYVASFYLNSPTEVVVNQGGSNPLLLNLQPFASEIAAPTALGDRTSVQGRIDRTNVADVYSFEAQQNQIVTIDMTATSGGSLDPQLILLGPDSAVVASNDDASDQTRNSLIGNQRLPTAGRYIIIATRFGKDIGGTEGDYVLTISGLGAQVAVNPTPGGAALPTPVGGATPTQGVAVSSLGSGLPAGIIEVGLLWDNRSDLRLLVRDPEKRALFSDVRQLPGGAALVQQSNLNCQNTTTAPTTYAYWPRSVRPSPGTYEIQVWLNNQCNEIALPNYTLSVVVNGNQVINVQNQPDPTGLLFVTTFTIDASGGATAGQGGIFTRQATTDLGDISAALAAAPALVYGRAVSGVIDTTSTYGVYTFQGRSGDRIRISMRATRGSLDTFLWALDSTGTQLAFNDDVTPGRDTNSRIDLTIPADGGYIIIATRFGANYGGTTGSYELSIAPQ